MNELSVDRLKRFEKTKVVALEHAKLIPQAIDIEEAILGSMMLDKNGLEDAMLIIPTSDVFYKQNHVLIFEAIQSLYQRGEGIDLLTVSRELKKHGSLEDAGGDFYLIQLTQKVSSSAHIDYWCRIALQHWMRRKVIMFSSQNISLAYDDTVDVFELMSGWQKAFDSISDAVFTGRSTISFPQALQDLKQQVELLTNNKSEVKLVGVDTGFKCLNKTTGGWREQDLVIVAARPGMGKTSYVLKTCIENVKKDVPVGFISLEMSVQQLTARCVAIDTNFHLRQLLKNGFEKAEYFNVYSSHQNRMNNYPFYIDDGGRTDINDVCIKAKLWHRKFGIKLLVIDFVY